MRNFINGTLAPVLSDTVDVRFLAANTAETHTVPTGASFVNFSSSGDFYCKIGTAAAITASPAAVPAADITDGTGSTLNPGTRQIPAGADRISLIMPTAGTITMEFWG